MAIRALRDSDDRSRFASGDADLDRFFQRYAGQNQFRHHVGTTYVSVEGGDILGFATVAPGQFEIDALPAAQLRKLPRYPLPVLRLARLAVATTAQGRGLGSELLRFVLDLAARLADEYGCVGVVVDAKSGAQEFYRRHGFFDLAAVEGHSAARPRATPMFLPIAAVKAAIAARSRRREA